MARPTPSQVAGGLWHLSVDDLFGPTDAPTRLGGPGPFVINLSASSAPVNIPATPLACCPQAHLYQIQRYEDGRVRYRLRLGAFYNEEDMDPILDQVRESYPSALTATAGPDDLFAIETLCAKADARRRPVALQPRTVSTDKVATAQASEDPPVIEAAKAPVRASEDSLSEDSNSLAQLVETITVLTAQLIESQPIAKAPPVAASIPTLERSVAARATPQAARTPSAPARAAVAAASMTSVSASAATETTEPLTLELLSVAPAATPPAAKAPLAMPAVASAPLAAAAVATPAAASAVTAGAATSTALAAEAAAAPTSEREEPFVLELVKDTPVVPTDTEVPAPVTYSESLGIDIAPFIAAAAQKTSSAAVRTGAESSTERVAPKPAPPSPKPSFSNFVRQALRRMPLSRTAGADTAAAKVPSATPQGLSPAAVAQSVTAEARPSTVMPGAPAKPLTPATNAAGRTAPAKPVSAARASPAMNTAAAKSPPTPATPHVTRSPAIPAAREKVPVPVNPELEIASTRTVRALTQQELADQSALRWFVVELATADSEFMPESIPHLDIYRAYRLYTVNTVDQGREVHSLRLGFFGDESAAKNVAGYLAAYYEKPIVKRISIAERRRFEEHGVEARKDVGATGKYAVIEITDELVVRENRLQGLIS